MSSSRGVFRLIARRHPNAAHPEEKAALPGIRMRDLQSIVGIAYPYHQSSATNPPAKGVSSSSQHEDMGEELAVFVTALKSWAPSALKYSDPFSQERHWQENARLMSLNQASLQAERTSEEH